MDLGDADRLLRYIVMGLPKSEVPVVWTPESSAMWDRLSAEVVEIKAKGWEVDLSID